MTERVEVIRELRAEVAVKERLTRSDTRRILHRVYEQTQTPFSGDEKRAIISILTNVRGSEGANRAYLMSTQPDVAYALRAIFPNLAERNNVSRYSSALQELKRRDVPPDDFYQAIDEAGGIACLWRAFRDRERGPRSVTRQNLNLSRQISATVGEVFTLKLKAMPNGLFEVLEVLRHD